MKYTIILVLTFIMSVGVAQKIDGYILTLPAQMLDGGGKVYVEDFNDLKGNNAAFGKAYAEALKKALQAERVAIGSVGKIQNPWITTKVYEIAASKEDADYVLSGEYSTITASSNTNKPVYIKETGTTEKIPVCYYDYTVSNSATIMGNLFVTAKGQAEPMKKLPFQKKAGDSKTKALEKPSVRSASDFISSAEKASIQDYQYYFSPIIKSKKYKFEKLKADDKSYKKELKQQTKDLKDLADKGDIMGMGKIYKASLEKPLKDIKEGYLNLGMCYEIIGNYTKAKECYEKAGDSGAMKELNKLILDRDKLVSLGLEVKENDF
jgi:tetratricopeptide (TPR) repeat protein